MGIKEFTSMSKSKIDNSLMKNEISGFNLRMKESKIQSIMESLQQDSIEGNDTFTTRAEGTLPMIESDGIESEILHSLHFPRSSRVSATNGRCATFVSSPIASSFRSFAASTKESVIRTISNRQSDVASLNCMYIDVVLIPLVHLSVFEELFKNSSTHFAHMQLLQHIQLHTDSMRRDEDECTEATEETEEIQKKKRKSARELASSSQNDMSKRPSVPRFDTSTLPLSKYKEKVWASSATSKNSLSNPRLNDLLDNSSENEDSSHQIRHSPLQPTHSTASSSILPSSSQTLQNEDVNTSASSEGNSLSSPSPSPSPSLLQPSSSLPPYFLRFSCPIHFSSINSLHLLSVAYNSNESLSESSLLAPKTLPSQTHPIPFSTVSFSSCPTPPSPLSLQIPSSSPSFSYQPPSLLSSSSLSSLSPSPNFSFPPPPSASSSASSSLSSSSNSFSASSSSSGRLSEKHDVLFVVDLNSSASSSLEFASKVQASPAQLSNHLANASFKQQLKQISELLKPMFDIQTDSQPLNRLVFSLNPNGALRTLLRIICSSNALFKALKKSTASAHTENPSDKDSSDDATQQKPETAPVQNEKAKEEDKPLFSDLNPIPLSVSSFVSIKSLLESTDIQKYLSTSNVSTACAVDSSSSTFPEHCFVSIVAANSRCTPDDAQNSSTLHPFVPPNIPTISLPPSMPHSKIPTISGFHPARVMKRIPINTIPIVSSTQRTNIPAPPNSSCFVIDAIDTSDSLSHVHPLCPCSLPSSSSIAVPLAALQIGTWTAATGTGVDVSAEVSLARGCFTYRIQHKKALISHFINSIDIPFHTIIHASVSFSVSLTNSTVEELHNNANQQRAVLSLVVAVPPLFRLSVQSGQREGSMPQPDFTSGDQASVVARHLLHFSSEKDLEQVLMILGRSSAFYSLFLQSNYSRLLPALPPMPQLPQISRQALKASCPLNAVNEYCALTPSKWLMDVVATGATVHSMALKRSCNSVASSSYLSSKATESTQSADSSQMNDSLSATQSVASDYSVRSSSSERYRCIVPVPPFSVTVYEMHYSLYFPRVTPRASLISLLAPLLNPEPLRENAPLLFFPAIHLSSLHLYADVAQDTLVCPRTKYWVQNSSRNGVHVLERVAEMLNRMRKGNANMLVEETSSGDKEEQAKADNENESVMDSMDKIEEEKTISEENISEDKRKNSTEPQNESASSANLKAFDSLERLWQFISSADDSLKADFNDFIHPLMRTYSKDSLHRIGRTRSTLTISSPLSLSLPPTFAQPQPAPPPSSTPSSPSMQTQTIQSNSPSTAPSPVPMTASTSTSASASSSASEPAQTTESSSESAPLQQEQQQEQQQSQSTATTSSSLQPPPSPPSTQISTVNQSAFTPASLNYTFRPDVIGALANVLPRHIALARMANYEKWKRETIRRSYAKAKYEKAAKEKLEELRAREKDGKCDGQQTLEKEDEFSVYTSFLTDEDMNMIEGMDDEDIFDLTGIPPLSAGSRLCNKKVFCQCKTRRLLQESKESMNSTFGKEAADGCSEDNERSQGKSSSEAESISGGATLYQSCSDLKWLADPNTTELSASSVVCPCLLAGEPCSPACSCDCCANPLNTIPSDVLCDCAQTHLINYHIIMRRGELSHLVALPCRNPIRFTPTLIHSLLYPVSLRIAHQGYRGYLCLEDYHCICHEPVYFCFCSGHSLLHSTHWHCSDCGCCRDLSLFHCKRCGHCSRETDLPCQCCSHRPALESWRNLMNSIGSRRTSTSAQAVVNVPVHPHLSAEEKREAECWEREVLAEDLAWVRLSRRKKPERDDSSNDTESIQSKSDNVEKNDSIKNAAKDEKGENKEKSRMIKLVQNKKRGKLMWINFDQQALPEGQLIKFVNDIIIKAYLEKEKEMSVKNSQKNRTFGFAFRNKH
ncbi:uncharacterized protein MONOS_3014 [Monocercomonoides exilis]|uniref:uncharacterized protein n=1 Tax=Monocercomonoides exilis TaxID=2049356 RepID=UPI0035598DA2|nr:hypothetical protein MONOS_3014 [Monocercomonoides exilis]|eukprot:MONOS_3014.1-p1 / transcript=MONOS_3014.1 / gene=MONOS_3014 / organism=Monocercomonoides_exilis_PA203 / gene_product=unspecified product / transcript_product=unspecified product / location=Mono_scaffold00067:14132-19922(+) / protein_length=1902 / sequence_SO=supercontig / SO=protein_coding / is_pseudo=false